MTNDKLGIKEKGSSPKNGVEKLKYLFKDIANYMATHLLLVEYVCFHTPETPQVLQTLL